MQKSFINIHKYFRNLFSKYYLFPWNNLHNTFHVTMRILAIHDFIYLSIRRYTVQTPHCATPNYSIIYILQRHDMGKIANLGKRKAVVPVLGYKFIIQRNYKESP